MIVSGEFLVIEDDKAVIKTLEKKIDVYEFLLDFEKKIKTLDKEDVVNRLSSIKIGDSIKIFDFFSKECDKRHI